MSNLLQHFNRPNKVAWFFFISAMITTLGMGTWQVQRLQWKEGLIAGLAEANRQAPLTVLPKDEEELKTLQFRRVIVKGNWNRDVEFHITPRYWHDQFGYWIITPLQLKDGRTVLVNRGWVPGAKKLAEKRPETAVHGYASINGLIRVGAERSYFTPASNPEKNIWFGRDIAQMAEFAKLKNVVPVMVDAVGEQDDKHLPIPSDGTIRLRNDHLSYIFTWYGIALGILVIFVVYHKRGK